MTRGLAFEAAIEAVLAGDVCFDSARLRADVLQRCTPAAVGQAFGALYRQVLGR